MEPRQTIQPVSGMIRACIEQDRSEVLRIINAAAEAYRDVIPADRFHDPYMSEDELISEISDGVIFHGFDLGGLVGVMGVQRKTNVDLLRHAYVHPSYQGRGIGSALLAHLFQARGRPILIGTWRSADWAIRFYERHGFVGVPDADTAALLRAYWTVPAQQIEASIVLSAPVLRSGDAARLITESLTAPSMPVIPDSSGKG